MLSKYLLTTLYYYSFTSSGTKSAHLKFRALRLLPGGFVCPLQGVEGTMKNIKFVVKVLRSGVRPPEYVQRIDRIPIQMTTNLKLALVMGKLTAEDAVKSIQNSKCSPELVSVQVSA
jgi:hypothetical protein